MLTRLRARAGRQPTGQSMVEFALLAPLFFLLLIGLADVARGVYDYNVISNAAREGAREAVLAYNECSNTDKTACGFSPPAQASLIGVDDAVQRAGGGAVGFTFKTDAAGAANATAPTCTTPPANQGCVWVFILNGTQTSSCTPPNPAPAGTDTWTVCNFDANKEGGSHDVVVEIKFNFLPLTPLVKNVMGNSITMWAKSEMKTEY